MSLKIVVLYQDFATGVRARHVLERVAGQLAPAAGIAVEFMRFDWLPRAPGLNSGHQLVVVSAHHWQAVPDQARQWVRKWYQRLAVEPWAYALLLDPPEQSRLVMTRSPEEVQPGVGAPEPARVRQCSM